jgi:hypothetical protein
MSAISAVTIIHRSGWILGLALFLGISGPMKGSILPPVELPTDREEQAEYHFHLAQAYEFWGWIGGAHRHYELVHDRYSSYGVSEAATRRMEELRNLPTQDGQPAGMAPIPGAFHRHYDWNRCDYSVPSLNPWTTVAKGKIWPPVTKVWANPYWPTIAGALSRITKPAFREVGRCLGFHPCGHLPPDCEFKGKEPEWSIPGSGIPWLRDTASRPVFGIWN